MVGVTERRTSERRTRKAGADDTPVVVSGSSRSRSRGHRRLVALSRGLGSIALLVLGVFIARQLTPDVQIGLSVDDPADTLTNLPRHPDPNIVVDIANHGTDDAKGIVVTVGGKECDDILTVDAKQQQQVVCDIPRNAVGEKEPRPVEIKASVRKSDAEASQMIDVQWAPLLCPDYSTLLPGKRAVLGSRSPADLRKRWNAAIVAMSSSDCHLGVDDYALTGSAVRGRFADGAGDDGPGSYKIEVDRNRNNVATGIVVTLEGDHVADEANVMRLLAAVAASDAQSATEMIAPESGEGDGAPTPEISAAARPCGARIEGIEITTTLLDGGDKQIAVRTCSA